MKPIGLIALAALAFASCQKPASQSENTPEPAEPSESAPATPVPKPIAAATPAATPAPELAPPGRYFLRRKVSIETSDGIVGFAPGTSVDQTAPGQFRTLDGQTLAITDVDVTNDMAEARRLAGHDRAAQSALRPSATPENTRAHSAARDAAASASQAAVEESERRRAKARIAALEQQEAQLQQQEQALLEKRSREQYNAAVKGRVVASTTQQQVDAVAAQIKRVREQISALNRDLQ